MTNRNFWLGFFTYFAFFAVMVLCAFTFGQASTFDPSGFTEDELFRLDIETVPARNEVPFFALLPQQEYESFEDLIKRGQPNLVVRVTLEERGRCRVYDPTGTYDNTDLFRSKTPGAVCPASLYICSPYEAKIEEVLLGDETMFPEGDYFTFWAPYGMGGEHAVRYADTPLFWEEFEYIMFFSVLDIEGVGRWYDLTHPSSAVEIMPLDERTFSSLSYAGNRLFDATDYDTETLEERLRALYGENPYPLDVPKIAPIK